MHHSNASVFNARYHFKLIKRKKIIYSISNKRYIALSYRGKDDHR
jgi:hypothetical protein